MITVPVGSGMYQAVLQGQGVTIDNGQVQVIGTPLQLTTANGTIQHVVKLDPGSIKTDQEASPQAGTSSSGNANADSAALSLAALQQGVYQKGPSSGTLTITPVGSSTVHHHPVTTAATSSSGSLAAARAAAAAQAAKASATVTSTTGVKSRSSQSPTRQPDTSTESLD